MAAQTSSTIPAAMRPHRLWLGSLAVLALAAAGLLRAESLSQRMCIDDISSIAVPETVKPAMARTWEHATPTSTKRSRLVRELRAGPLLQTSQYGNVCQINLSEHRPAAGCLDPTATGY